MGDNCEISGQPVADQASQPDSTQMRMTLWIKHLTYAVPYRQGRNGSRGGRDFATFSTPGGDHYIVAFTSSDELKKWPDADSGATFLSFDELKYTVLANPNELAGIAIDPFSKNILLGQKQIAAIDLVTEGIGIHSVQHTGAIRLHEPEEKVPVLADALRIFFSCRDQVFKAFMLLGREPSDDKEKLLFIVDFNGNESELFPELARIICRHMRQGEEFELMKATYGLICAAEKTCRPIYRRH